MAAPQTKFLTNDRILRDAIKLRLAARHHGSDAVVLEELPTTRGSGRLDVAVINGRIEGIEIKSDQDTLGRLASQVTMFSPAVDKMSLVVGDRHFENAVSMIPNWWGVIHSSLSRSGAVKLKLVRPGRLNKFPDPLSLTQMLERDELVTLLAQNGLDRGWRTAPYDALAERTVSLIPQRLLAAGVRELIKHRATFESLYERTAFGRTALIFSKPAASDAGLL